MSSQQHNYHVRTNTDLVAWLQKRNSFWEYKTYDGKGPITERAQEIR